MMINKKGKVKRFDLTEENMLEIMSKAKRVAKVILSGMMGVVTSVNSLKIISMVKASIFGRIKEFMKENGNLIKWMGFQLFLIIFD